MFQHYTILAQHIQQQVKSVNWIDLDKGQLENSEQYNSLITPALLVGNSEIEWKQLGSGNQIGEGTITTRLVFRLPSQTHVYDPLLKKSVTELNLADDVHDVILSVPGVLSRIRSKDYPSDTFYVVEQTYSVAFESNKSLTQKTVQVHVNPFLTT